MPNSCIDPHGEPAASATPFSNTSRISGAEAWTLVAPKCVIQLAITALGGRTLSPDMSVGATTFFLVQCSVPGSGANVLRGHEPERKRCDHAPPSRLHAMPPESLLRPGLATCIPITIARYSGRRGIAGGQHGSAHHCVAFGRAAAHHCVAFSRSAI